MLTNEQMSTLRSMLNEELEDIKNRLEEHEHFGLDNASLIESLGELSSYDNHPGDLGSELFEREKDVALNEFTEQEAKDIIWALKAMDEGTYGQCQVCHDDIPFERLEAMPTTLRCIQHAEEKVVSKSRPAEEDILQPPFEKFNYDGADVTIYDAEDAWQDVAKYGSSETPSDFVDPSKFSYNKMYMDSGRKCGLR